MTPQEIVKGLANYQNAAMRQEIRSVGSMKFIVDCYNASPDSMRASLGVLAGIEAAGRRVAVLGDMLELGSISEEQHFEIGRHCARLDLDMLVCYGDIARHIKRGAIVAGMRNVVMFEDKEEATAYLSRVLEDNDTVLFKASRGMALEEIINPLQKMIEER